jgi:hypothetical protein
MDRWLEELAEALGERPPAADEYGALLRLAREVAHGVERKFAPLSTFLVGAALGRRVAAGEPRGQAFADAVEAALGVIPPREGEGPTGG